MNEVEAALRETMRVYDALAPTTAEFRFRPPRHTTTRRRSRWLAAAAAAACVLVAAAVTLTVGRPRHTNPAAADRHPGSSVVPAPSCPARIAGAVSEYWIPQPPKGVDAANRFVPLETPVRAVVCAYLHGDNGHLTRSRLVRGDLSTIPADLAWLPPITSKGPCAAYLAVTDGDAYLMALSYPNGLMWLSIPGNHCAGASNGTFEAGNLRTQADTTYRTGVWRPAPPTTIDDCRVSAGRLGQQNRLVPDGAVSVQICQQGRHPRTVNATQTDLARLVSAVNRLPTATWSHTFTCGSIGKPTASYILTFGYHVGPPVQVSIRQGCRPAIDNGSLQTDSANTVLPLVHQRLAPN